MWSKLAQCLTLFRFGWLLAVYLLISPVAQAQSWALDLLKNPPQERQRQIALPPPNQPVYPSAVRSSYEVASNLLSNEQIFGFEPTTQSQEPFAYQRPSSLLGVNGDLTSTIQWVLQSGDHQQLPFVVADKRAGMVYVVSASGKIIDQSVALYGKILGDEPLEGQTPAGAFTMQKHLTDEAGYSGDVMFFWSEGGSDYALHRTYRLYPRERRPQRLATPTSADNRISNGCINVPEVFYDRIMSSLHGARLYVLPEHSATFNVENRGMIYQATPVTPQFVGEWPEDTTEEVVWLDDAENAESVLSDAESFKASRYW